MKARRTLKLKLPSKDFQKSFPSQSQIQRQRKISRTKKIKQKNVVYPMSNPDKIVFITNQYGTGFRRQKIEEFNCPSHIPIDRMLKQINQACYEVWKTNYQKLSSTPFQSLQIILGVIFLIIFLITVVYFSLITNQQTNAFDIMNYIIISVILIIFGLAFYVFLSKKQSQQSLDLKLIQAIQEKLVEFNKNQQELYFEQPRFRWTCHQDCLWIALNL